MKAFPIALAVPAFITTVMGNPISASHATSALVARGADSFHLVECGPVAGTSDQYKNFGVVSTKYRYSTFSYYARSYSHSKTANRSHKKLT